MYQKIRRKFSEKNRKYLIELRIKLPHTSFCASNVIFSQNLPHLLLLSPSDYDKMSTLFQRFHQRVQRVSYFGCMLENPTSKRPFNYNNVDQQNFAIFRKFRQLLLF